MTATLLTTPSECAELAGVLAEVWGLADPTGVAAPDMLTALAYSGGYVAGTRIEGRLVGGGYGWPTAVNGEWRLHSHVVGFVGGWRAHGLGREMKLHQRAWARTAGLAAVEWTFDPLHAANAHFNLHTLGATVEAFVEDFYGPITDAFQVGLPSDRFVVRWGLDAEPRPRVIAGTVADGIVVPIPADVVALRTSDVVESAAWAERFRHTIGPALDAGATVVGLTADNEYVLRPPHRR